MEHSKRPPLESPALIDGGGRCRGQRLGRNRSQNIDPEVRGVDLLPN